MKSIWLQVRKLATESGIPDKPRALLREYLQIKAIDYIYSNKQANNLSFVGGTSLRLLSDLPRFSEDLDFDNLGLTLQQVNTLLKMVKDQFDNENIPVELFEKVAADKTYYELRFPSLLKELEISTNPREKLMIKVDYSNNWIGQRKRVVLMRRMGVIQNVVTNELDQILVQKLTAYATRKMVQPRDIYDVVWLYAQGAKLDREFMKMNKITDLLERVKLRWEKTRVSSGMKGRLSPFLFREGEVDKLDLFESVIGKLVAQS